MSRPRLRGLNEVVHIRSVQGHALRKDTIRNGMKLVDGGHAVPLKDRTGGRIVGFQLISLLRFSDETPGMISATEAKAVAGEYGKSTTAHLTDAARTEREKAGFEAEDFIERAIEKVRIYSELRDAA